MLKISFDGPLDIATGKTRKTANWKNTKLLWSELVARLTKTHRTAETYADYMAFKRDKQDEIKDVGGFVGGYLVNGKRKKGSVAHRQIITLDIDSGTGDEWGNFGLLNGCAACIYSTHKHSADTPRYRLVIPLSREISADEYEPICRRIAADIGIEAFTDTTTYQEYRLMYWPSTSSDGLFFSDQQDGSWLDPDTVLATYRNWKDVSEWPAGNFETEQVRRDIKKQEDPLEKRGVIGAFCRTYGIAEVIEKYLPDVYTEGTEGRYTYIHGSTGNGAVVYEDKWLYTHHGSDPCSGKLCNAFDLVRVHKFGHLDDNTDQVGVKLPSFKAASAFCADIPEVRSLVARERIEEAKYDFSQVEDQEPEDPQEEPANDDWTKLLKIEPKGNVIMNTIENVTLILENDKRLKGRFAMNDFEKREVVLKALPWRILTKDTRYLDDSDDANLRNYLESVYDITTVSKIKDALDIVVARHKFHPVKNYLDPLVWDGEERVSTLLIDYLGAEDNEYTRTVTCKTLVAAIARIYKPGIKFDTVLSLAGEEGVGKSELISRLGGPWFSDSFSFHMLNSKEANEQVQGAWIIEIAEMSGLNNAETEASKSFISRQEDRYRIAYGKRLSYFPRQCIFIGSSNKDDFLKRIAGNRRFWPVKILVEEPAKSVFDDLTVDQVKQVWAEAVELYKAGETLHLSKEMQAVAKEVQLEFTEVDEREGIIRAFLNRRLPDNWESLDLQQRRSYIHNDDDVITAEPGTVKRTRVCAAEIWCELFNGYTATMTTTNTKFIHTAMHNITGWKKAKGNLLFRLYGRQRGYYLPGQDKQFLFQK